MFVTGVALPPRFTKFTPICAVDVLTAAPEICVTFTAGGVVKSAGEPKIL